MGEGFCPGRKIRQGERESQGQKDGWKGRDRKRGGGDKRAIRTERQKTNEGRNRER